MKLTVNKPVEIEADAIRVELPVRYEEEDIPNDFPLRDGDMWRGTIDIATGKIRKWPAGKTGEMFMKVCDQGCYYLLNGNETISSIEEDYVISCIPGEYGDYVDFKIDADGAIADWADKCDEDSVRKSFFRNDDD